MAGALRTSPKRRGRAPTCQRRYASWASTTTSCSAAPTAAGIIPEKFPWQAMLASGRFVNNVLVDGMLRAIWDRARRQAPCGARIRPFRKLCRVEREEVVAEAARMLDSAAPDRELRDVRLEPAVP